MMREGLIRPAEEVRVVVVPDADMVIACFGGNYNARAGWAVVTEHIPKYILGAVKK